MSSTPPPSKYPTIAIIGGGPSGLVALLTLLTRGIPATLYERETSSAARAYLGGMLDLTWSEGQRALRENGLAEAFKANSRLDAQNLIICGKDGIPLMRRTEDDVKDETQSRPEIDRRVLRDIMLAALPESAVKWGHALTSVRPLEEGSGRHELTFTNGLVVVTDILIGADGARSRVRPLVSPAQPLYHGIIGAEISVSPAVAALPENTEGRRARELPRCVGREDLHAAAQRQWTHPDEREAAVAAVEEKICAHAETFAAKSYRNVDIYFGPGAPQAVVDAFTKARR